MSEAGWAALGAIAMAAINMIGSVLLVWIKARYGVSETRNGNSVKGTGPNAH